MYAIVLYGSLAVFLVGMIYRISNWFRFRIGRDASSLKPFKRLSAAVKGTASTLFSAKFFTWVRICVMDLLFHRYFLKTSKARWFAHLCIYWGFILLLLMHALDKLVTSVIFQNYYSTLNPFLFLRNFFGLMVLVGLGMAFYRRMAAPRPRPASMGMDYYALGILSVIMISGIALESTQILSQTVYEEMVADYTSLTEDDQDAVNALSAYWVKNYGVVSDNVQEPFSEDLLAEGALLHEESCMECHSRPQWAFMSYGLSRGLRPVAGAMDRAGLHRGVWWVHVLSCLLGLAYLPFSKFFHMLSTPVFLLAKGLSTEVKKDSPNAATLQAIEMDACVHCGDCNLRCSIAVALHEIPNPRMLPSEKHAAFRSLLIGRHISKKKLMDIQEGSFICTDCRRCTDACPIGLNLESLWRNLKLHAAALGFPKPELWARTVIGEEYVVRKFGEATLTPSLEDRAFTRDITASASANTFTVCFGCQKCTNVCPVVASYESPRKALGLLPHEIMHCLALRQKDLVLGSMMLWDCLTCYLCQEQCPQGVCITDVLYQLKNMAYKRLREEA